MTTLRTRRPAASTTPPSMRADRVGPGWGVSPATNPVLPAPAAAGFRAKEPSLPIPAVGRGVPASAAGQGCLMPAVFPSASAARAAATGPSQRVVQVGSPLARQEALRLVARSAGRPLDPAEASLPDASFTSGGVLVHDDAMAKRAAALLGAHAFALGDHLFLGPTVGASGGPTRSEALRHALAHRSQARGRRLERGILALDQLPQSRSGQPLAGAQKGFLLLPPDLDPGRDPAAAAGWLRTHSTRLRWVPDSHFALEAEG